MVFDISNAYLINTKDFSMHDDVLYNMCFIREKKELVLSLKKTFNSTKTYTVVYSNVVGFFMSSCDFWGDSPRICGIEYNDSTSKNLCEVILPKLRSIDSSYDNNSLVLAKGDVFFETDITFISGDKLIVACEFITVFE